MWKIAGVTFEDRQEKIRKLRGSLGRVITCYLEKTMYDGEPAIKVLEKETRQQIGWIPRQNIKELYNKNIEKIYGEIGWFKDTWYVQLYNPTYIRN